MTGFGNLKAKTDVWVGYDGNGFFSHDGNSVAIVSGSLYVGAAASVTGVGKYTLFGNGILDMDGGGGNIHVGDSSGVGRFEWKSSTSAIRPQGGSMIIGANGTLAMGFNFGLGALLVDANSLFASRGTLDISAGQLEIFNTATATVEANRSVTIGKLNVVNGTLSMSSGSSLTVTNSLALDSNFVSADPNAKIIIQPPRGSNTASLNVAVTDPNKVAGLGNVTLQFQFDPNQTGTPQTVTLAVAGQPYDANKTVDQNFSTANYVINHLIVGRGDANTGNTGTLLKLAGNVYVKKLDILQGGNIDPNGFVSV
jgi:hypothetical protein